MRVFFSNRAQFPSPPLTKHRLTNRKEAGAVYTPVSHYDFSFLLPPSPIRVINIVADPWQLSCLVSSLLSLSLSATRPFRDDTVTTQREHKVASQFHAPFFPLPPFEWPEIRDCIILLMSTTRWLKNDATICCEKNNSYLSCTSVSSFLIKFSSFLFTKM